jgi:TIR domain
MSADVFISYASQDARMASTICTAIENRGFKCWIATRDIMPGENFQSAIVRAIRSAKVLLLVFTANSNRSDEMTKELALASQQKLMVVPLRVENVAPSDAFAYEFATRQWIDLFADWEQAMNHLCSRLSAALEDDRTHVDTIVLGKP